MVMITGNFKATYRNAWTCTVKKCHSVHITIAPLQCDAVGCIKPLTDGRTWTVQFSHPTSLQPVLQWSQQTITMATCSKNNMLVLTVFMKPVTIWSSAEEYQQVSPKCRLPGRELLALCTEIFAKMIHSHKYNMTHHSNAKLQRPTTYLKRLNTALW
jgi:hypothetical protein